MPRNPTRSQQLAIDTRDRSVLLSAAAGSGKTFTLTQRIIDSLLDPVAPADISRMLIVTFTVAATLELRSRISEELNKALANDPGNKHLNRQLSAIGSAEISTIDSFFLDVVRSNFQDLTLEDGSPLPGDFRLADNTELDAIRAATMETVLDAWFDKPDDNGFSRFADAFADRKSEGTLANTLIDYCKFLDSLPSPAEYTYKMADKIADCAGRDFFLTDYGKVIKESIDEELDYFSEILSRASDFMNIESYDKKYGKMFDYNSEFVSSLKAASGSPNAYDAMRTLLISYSPPPIGRSGESCDELAVYRSTVESRLKPGGMLSEFFSLTNDEIARIALRTADDMRILAAVSGDFRREYLREKRQRHICEFSDITRLTHKLLVAPDGGPTETALSYRARFDAVYVDEYQDLNSIQDDIFRAVAPPDKRFTVGDIKQSIYSFRGAEPAVFGAMRDSLPAINTPEAEGKPAVSLFMSENFRCDTGIIDFVNLVSEHTFRPAGGEVNYRDEDRLIASKENPGARPAVFAAFDSKDDEFYYLASEIARLISEETLNNGNKIKPGDITVLVRKSFLIPLVSEALSLFGIDSVGIGTEQLFETAEVRLVLSLVKIIDNPSDDIALAAALLSPFFGFTLDDVIKIRRGCDTSYSLYEALEICSQTDPRDDLGEKCAKLIETLDRLRRTAARIPVDRFINGLYGEFGIMSLSGDRDKKDITANLRYFYEYARNFTATQTGGLCGFISYINSIIDSGTEVPTPPRAQSDNAVTIMTIHKSKGLEFPVVFVCGCGSAIHPKPSPKRHNGKSDSLERSNNLGVALKLADDTGYILTDTPFRAAIVLENKRRATEEEMRTLYVALTRATERLYVTANSGISSLEKKTSTAAALSCFNCRAKAMSASSYLDWLTAATVKPDRSFVKVTSADLPAPVDEFSFADGPDDLTLENTFLTDVDEEAARVIAERLDFVYPHAAALSLPAKLSVSVLHEGLLDDDDAALLSPENLPAMLEAPSFMSEENEEISAAKKGTATHVFLQFCDFCRAEKNVKNELDRLVAEKFIPTNMADLVSIRNIERFFSSELYSEIKNAREIYREKRFNILLEAADFTSDPELREKLSGEPLLVQGVIDIFFIDAQGKIILCDYKTDHLTKDELKNEALDAEKLISRHAEQLRYYCAAVKKLLGSAPDRVCIYSLPLGKAIDVDPAFLK